MAHSNVASCVLSIVGSFSNGLDVFKKLREKRHRKKKPKKNDPAEGEETRLSRSLRRGQEDIGREYQNNIFAVGDHFAIGDGMMRRYSRKLMSLTNRQSSYCSNILGGDPSQAEHRLGRHNRLFRKQRQEQRSTRLPISYGNLRKISS